MASERSRTRRAKEAINKGQVEMLLKIMVVSGIIKMTALKKRLSSKCWTLSCTDHV